MAIAATTSLSLSSPTRRSLSSSITIFRQTSFFLSLHPNSLRSTTATALRYPCLRISASSMSIEAPEKDSRTSFLDRKQTGILHFVKYHGLGNDFILVDNRDSMEPRVTPEQAVKLCDRNFGIGADGVIFAMPGTNGTDYTMRIFNSDGSEPEMCGNGVRCFARFIAELDNLHGRHSFTIHTGAGLIVPEIQDDGKVRVDMGEPILKASNVPTKLPANEGQSVVKSELNVDGVTWNVTCVSMGNPHCVTFGTKGSQVDELNLAQIGPKFEHHEMFPARTNTEFVQVFSRSHLKMRVWERGAGATLACGTGACAVVVAAVLEGHAGRVSFGCHGMMSLTPDQFRKVGLGVSPSPSPFYTPRPERRRADSRVFELNSNRQDKEREVNVQVLLRCRPLSDDEQRLNVPRVITCNEHKREVNVLQSLANKQVDRIFTFDKVFGPKAQQRSIYDQAIVPIVNEVLEGFNCTVFAYGQTGTGKTYTMEGGMRNKGGELPAEAGVIPRAVRQIFDTLEAQNADYSMKVTFLELYNEEITDLLAPEDYSRTFEDKQKKPISLMEDGKGCVILRGLEEEAVYSANEIYNLLERGAAKRRTADTLLNKRSSRSHSVFTITIHVKETTVGDEELIKCGKLNLVDLAGSENISRSGAREGRAREAGEINKSLLTLGRVINALVEHSAHIPYRDSKLTRLLRDSLGGKTKTCIIATISPTAQCLEETLSTLDYACRAKNIKNKPEANQKMSKAVLLKDLYLEIERMKQDVRAAREKNGVYIPHERHAQDEADKKAKNEKIEQLEIDLNLSAKQVDKFRELYLTEQEEKLELDSELNCCKINLENSNKVLEDLQEKHKVAISTLKEKEFIISKLFHSENSLIDRAKEMRANLQIASEDISALFAKLDQKNKLEAENQGLLLNFGSQLDQSLKDLHKTILGSVSQQQQQLRCMEEHVSSFLASKYDATRILESRINKLTEINTLGVTTLKELADSLQMKATLDLEQIKSTMSCQISALENFLKTVVSEAKYVVCDIQNTLNEQKQILALSAQQQQEGLHRSMASAEVISRATIDFFNDLSHRAFQLKALLEESQIDKSHQLATFERMFKVGYALRMQFGLPTEEAAREEKQAMEKIAAILASLTAKKTAMEEAAREEKQAMEKIAAILASLTAKKTAMVSEASRNIEDSTTQGNKRLLQGIFSMQQVSGDAKEEVNVYLEKVKRHFLEDTFTSAETKATMESCLQECTNMVNYSGRQWEKAELSINHLNKTSIAEIESAVKEKICANQAAYEEFVARSSSINAEYEAKACDTQAAVKDSLMLDQETKEEIDSMSSLCLNQLKCVGENHTESITNIRNQAGQCLRKDYLVDQHTGTTPKLKIIAVPSLASIEEMRTPAVGDLMANFTRPNLGCTESKIQQQQGQCVGASPNRTPFADVNFS
ncbi:hypothetical protein TEA_009148 [Camellia sinensis var. sinensis]|uniref:diaminopimelate epimerase n=1 Tax=Camellia sinensis var. sinensis TaxID=542762 RepID=A0A4S4EGL2_CAMSN|nr:hypothetical protein TEA_009148 [Camellia sinensis var. sinensis]